MENTGVIDLSHSLENSMQIYPGDPTFTCKPQLSLDKDGCNVQGISLGSHTGTHVDAPYHFFADGMKIDEIPLTSFIGQGLIVNLTTKKAREAIVWDDLSPYSSQMREGVILLIYTGWSTYWNTPKYYDHPFLSLDAAQRIMATGLRVVAVDALSPDETHVDGSEGKYDAHNVVLGAGGLIAENLTNLEVLIGKDVIISLVPLKIKGSDGSPIRAFASVKPN